MITLANYADGPLTDKKLLSHLSHIKLAGMLLEARSRQRAARSAARLARKKEVRSVLRSTPVTTLRRSA